MKRTYKVEITVDSDSNTSAVSRVEVKTPLDRSGASLVGISEVMPKEGWRPVDKREFTSRVLNNVDKFISR